MPKLDVHTLTLTLYINIRITLTRSSKTPYIVLVKGKHIKYHIDRKYECINVCFEALELLC